MGFNFSPEEAVGREAGEEEEKCLDRRGMASGSGKITQRSFPLAPSLNFLSSYRQGRMNGSEAIQTWSSNQPLH